ncbi:hypothetical protein [Nocardia stercoris]|uniref:Uncharacterized protein n=1 Tax=Nocardia stercoris TaxID=2483361 RepID=A0A3M2LBV1_9NOCA|nr:hypothetical protein [Nocardia stercoris]RMI34991.1 hypothetical protein EBN03_01180 [Nocardia stercoris]
MPAPDHDRHHWIDYATFGERFVAHAVSGERVAAAVAEIAGRGIKIGPFNIGPLGMAGFVAEGKVGTPEITPGTSAVSYAVQVPIRLHGTVRLAGQLFRLEAAVDIGLTLNARTADPLLIVIDIPPIRPADVSFVVRAQAIGSAFELLLEPIAALVQREVASRVNAILRDPAAQRNRVFDVAALIGGYDSDAYRRAEFDWIGYDEFGRRFFPSIVTADRVRAAVEDMAGRVIEVGPLPVGPREAATVRVNGVLRLPRLTERPTAVAPAGAGVDGDLVAFDLVVPVELEIVIDVLKANRYRADVDIPLVLYARAADPLLVVIDVVPPRPDDLVIRLRAEGWRAKTLGAVAGLRRQLAERIVSVVRGELADAAFRTIDAAAGIDRATGGVRRGTD